MTRATMVRQISGLTWSNDLVSFAPSRTGRIMPMSVTAWRSIAACTVSLAIGAAVLAAGEEQAPASTVVAYENGYWFAGSTFEPRRMYGPGQHVHRAGGTPWGSPDLVIDLHGGYVVPPFGEAHNHNVELIPSQPARLEATLNAYLRAGVFYVQRLPPPRHHDAVCSPGREDRQGHRHPASPASGGRVPEVPQAD